MSRPKIWTQSMGAALFLIAASVCGPLWGAPGDADSASDRMRVVSPERLMGMFRCGIDGDCLVGPYEVASVSAGPACELHVGLSRRDDGRTSTFVINQDKATSRDTDCRESARSGGGTCKERVRARDGIFIHATSLFQAQELSTYLDANAAARIFARSCDRAAPRFGGHSELETEDESPGPFDVIAWLWLSPIFVLLALVLLLFATPIAGALVSFLRRVPDRLGDLETALDSMHGPSLRLLVYVLAAATTTVGIVSYAWHPFETIYTLIPIHEMRDYYRSPVVGVAYFVWSRLGWLLGVGLSPWWYRLPNVILAVVVCRMFFQLGKTIDRPLVGLLSAVLFVFLPEFSSMRVIQQHYFLEFASSTWFLLAVARYIVLREERRTELVLATLAAVASGYMTILLLVPGHVALLVVAIRRRQLLWYARTAAIAAFAASPLLLRAASHALGHISFSQAAAGGVVSSSTISDANAANYGHVQAPSAGVGGGAAWALVREMTTHIFGFEQAWVFVVASLVVLVRSPLAWLTAASLLSWALLSGQMMISPLNTTPVWPFLLLILVWGGVVLTGMLRRVRLRGLSLVVLAIALITVSLVRAQVNSLFVLEDAKPREALYQALQVDPSMPLFVDPHISGYEFTVSRCGAQAETLSQLKACVYALTYGETTSAGYRYALNTRASVARLEAFVDPIDWDAVSAFHLCQAPWVDDTFLYLYHAEGLAYDAGGRSISAQLARHCRPVGRFGAEVLVRCEGASQACVASR